MRLGMQIKHDEPTPAGAQMENDCREPRSADASRRTNEKTTVGRDQNRDPTPTPTEYWPSHARQWSEAETASQASKSERASRSQLNEFTRSTVNDRSNNNCRHTKRAHVARGQQEGTARSSGPSQRRATSVAKDTIAPSSDPITWPDTPRPNGYNSRRPRTRRGSRSGLVRRNVTGKLIKQQGLHDPRRSWQRDAKNKTETQ